MKVLPFKVPKPENTNLIFQIDWVDEFYNRLHQHEEIQFSVILEGEGDLFVGDTIGRFKKGDVFFIGANVPHLFKSDLNQKRKSLMLTLFFTNSVFGENFFSLPELEELRPLLEDLEQGVRIVSLNDEIITRMKQVEEGTPVLRLILFLEMLHLCSQADRKLLSSFSGQRLYNEEEGERMSRVMNLALTEFHRTITLTEVADLVHMTPHSFCRYFKERTRKTFFQFLMEIRLDFASRMLLKKSSASIAEISDLAGFRNISHFNRQFKVFHNCTPSQFRSKKHS